MQKAFEESITVKQKSLSVNLESIEKCVKSMVKALKRKKKILIFGNGGSAADSQHIAAEFIGRFLKERQSLPAIALTTDTSIITALGNDYGFDVIFARQIEGLGQKGDIAIGISTSGNSQNVIKGITQAGKQGLLTVSLTGCHGGKLAKLTDISIIVPSNMTPRIQETHACIAHIICDLVECEFYQNK
ncbi:MAG: D-sedoheptulose 7-phosphate isomerase [Candidatus Omnitrophica bacterium]|nr:D-sedoheptulose 7-phosphate isomerase [Candidatus Omnitrophota bacterium]